MNRSHKVTVTQTLPDGTVQPETELDVLASSADLALARVLGWYSPSLFYQEWESK